MTAAKENAAAKRRAAAAELLGRKRARAAACTALLHAIGDCGRNFFKGSNGRARFEVDMRGRVWFVDDYSQQWIYTHHTRDDWRGFSHGGTLRDLVIKLRDFIATGSTIAPGHLGPWPDWICSGDLWGYGDDMVKVRRAALELGIVKVKDEAAYLAAPHPKVPA